MCVSVSGGGGGAGTQCSATLAPPPLAAADIVRSLYWRPSLSLFICSSRPALFLHFNPPHPVRSHYRTVILHAVA